MGKSLDLRHLDSRAENNYDVDERKSETRIKKSRERERELSAFSSSSSSSLVSFSR